MGKSKPSNFIPFPNWFDYLGHFHGCEKIFLLSLSDFCHDDDKFEASGRMRGLSAQWAVNLGGETRAGSGVASVRRMEARCSVKSPGQSRQAEGRWHC